MKENKTKNDYIKKGEERISNYLESTHFASNTMIVHQLSELSKPRLNPHIVTEALKNLLKKRIIFKINKPFQNKVNITCYTFQYSKKFQLERVEKRKKQIFPFLDRLKNNKNEEHNNLHKQLGYALEIPIFERLNRLTTDNNYELQGSFKNYTINDFNSAQKARRLFNLAKPSLQQWINKEITLTQLYQNVKNNSKSTKKIKKLIEDNINFVNQFNINKSY